MIYTAHNTRKAVVMEVETRAEIKEVAAVDTDKAQLTVFRTPYKVNTGGDLETYTLRFRSIYPFFGCGEYPILFHCYGRQP